MRSTLTYPTLLSEPPRASEWVAEKHYYRISRMSEAQRALLAPDVIEGYLKWLTTSEGRCIF